MSPRTPLQTAVAILTLCCVLLAANGCSSILTSGSLPFLSAKADTSPAPTASCTVEFHSEYGKPRKMTVPVTEQTRIQDVLETSHARSRFRQMNVMILRPAPRDPQQMVKLACNYDAGDRKVTWDTDYAVLPGDRVIVTRDTTSSVDGVMESVLGPVFGGKKQR